MRTRQCLLALRVGEQDDSLLIAAGDHDQGRDFATGVAVGLGVEDEVLDLRATARLMIV